MTATEFIKKWSPIEEPNLVTVFKDDFWSVLSDLKSEPFKSTAIEVLSDIKGAELIIDTNEHEHPEYPSGRIRFGKQGESLETGIVFMYPLYCGHVEADWLHLLKEIAKQTLK